MKIIPKEYDGQGLFVYCNRCKKQFKDNCGCEKGCVPERDWRYKMVQHVPEPNGPGKKHTKICASKTLKGALKELREFKAEQQMSSLLTSRIEGNTVQDCIDAFIRKKFNEGEYSNQKKVLSVSHKKDIIRVIERFKEALGKMNKKPVTMKIAELNASILKPFSDVVNSYGTGGAMQDRHTRIMRNFLKFLEERGMYSGGNFFKTISTESISSSPVAVDEEELNKVISVIKPENGIGKRGTRRRKNYFTPWMHFAFRLARLTGVRVEEIYELAWKNIVSHTKKGQEFQLLVIHNLKVERLRNEKNILKVIPITGELEELLEEIKNSKFTGDKIIESGMTLGYFRDCVSRAFTHFYEMAFGKKDKKFKMLRKTQLTDIASYLGPDAKLLTGHSGQNILDKHYVDKVQAAIKMMELKLAEEKRKKKK